MGGRGASSGRRYQEAHVFSAEVIDGKVVFVDPQNGDIDAEKYFSEQKVGFFGIARVDNLKINDYIKEVVEAKK